MTKYVVITSYPVRNHAFNNDLEISNNNNQEANCFESNLNNIFRIFSYNKNPIDSNSEIYRTKTVRMLG